MKVHITLDKPLRHDTEAKQALLRKLSSEYGLHGVNEGRFARLGILTGEVQEAAAVEQILAQSGIESVSVDEERHLL